LISGLLPKTIRASPGLRASSWAISVTPSFFRIARHRHDPTPANGGLFHYLSAGTTSIVFLFAKFKTAFDRYSRPPVSPRPRACRRRRSRASLLGASRIAMRSRRCRARPHACWGPASGVQQSISVRYPRVRNSVQSVLNAAFCFERLIGARAIEVKSISILVLRPALRPNVFGSPEKPLLNF